MNSTWRKRKKRIFEIIEVGNDLDYVSRLYDYVNALAIIINLAATILYTYEEMRGICGTALRIAEEIMVAFFLVDYILRVWTACFLYPELTYPHAVRKYMTSFTGIVDLFSFLPDYLPFFFPAGTVAFRMVRIVRIFRLFRINAYYDSLHVITEVIRSKMQQLISSVFIILVLMLASSLCMYSLEHEAQPEVFKNAFSGIWWAASTLLMVGYGDIYPVTPLGKMFGIFIAFLGVGMVAIPTGIISAGFVDQYSTIKKRTEYGYEADMHFIKIQLDDDDRWVGKSIAKLGLPSGVIVAAIRRKERLIVPQGSVVLDVGDTVILGAEPFKDHETINLKEIVLERENPWTGMRIQDLNISRHSVIVLVKRSNRTMIPRGNLVLREGDKVFLYTQLHLAAKSEIEI